MMLRAGWSTASRRCVASSQLFRTFSTEAPKCLLSEEEDGVLTLTLNRTRQRNALNRELLEALGSELDRAAQSPKDIRVVVFRSQREAPVFSAGHDLKEMMSGDASSQADLFNLCSSVMAKVPSIPQPTIAAVEGLATAAGCQLVAACDLVVASPMSGFATPGAKAIGLFCHTPAVSLVRSVGIKQALDMLYTGRTITAQEALNYGLVTQIAGNPHKDADELAKLIASKSAPAIQAGKRILYSQASAKSLKSAYEIASQAMVDNLKNEDAKVGINAFINKEHEPKWQHE
eukprot:Nitzschia sp. Nitz4//scaffold211_size37880//12748//13614//NITZ4_007703-RA/size37880-processed-gene-0.1-mRNA-1//1//CDS//3329541970//785//frame0